MAAWAFVTKGGVEMADLIQPLVEAVGDGEPPIDILNGVAINVTRLLGDRERAGEPNLKQWVHDFAAFLMHRFGDLEEK